MSALVIRKSLPQAASPQPFATTALLAQGGPYLCRSSPCFQTNWRMHPGIDRASGSPTPRGSCEGHPPSTPENEQDPAECESTLPGREVPWLLLSDDTDEFSPALCRPGRELPGLARNLLGSSPRKKNRLLRWSGGPGDCSPGPPQIRTCGTTASGSSCCGFASVRGMHITPYQLDGLPLRHAIRAS
jgi:hypothetical protein